MRAFAGRRITEVGFWNPKGGCQMAGLRPFLYPSSGIRLLVSLGMLGN
jgi:hypothetical protein